MTPDKIYVTTSTTYPVNPAYGNKWGCWSERKCPGYVYLHKNALLEWAKEKQEQMKIEAGGCSNMLAAGKYLAYSELIEKIESL